MPPKKEITRRMILDAALETIREEGLDAVTARNLARRMGCSTQPFYQAFDRMDDLKAAAYERALRLAQDMIRAYRDDRYEPALCLAIGYLELARGERALFRSVYLSGYSAEHAQNNLSIGNEMVAQHTPDSARLRNASIPLLKRIYSKISVYIAGLGAMVNTGAIGCTPEQAVEMVTDIYETVVVGELAQSRKDAAPQADALGRKLGSGANADVYEYGEGKAVKLFRGADQLQQLYREWRNHLIVQQTGLPVPRVYEPVEVCGLPGLVYERIQGPTVVDRLFTAQGAGDIQTLARLMHQINSVPVEQLDMRRIPNAKDILTWQINHAAGLTPAEKEALLDWIGELPPGTCLCHGDLNPLNVIIRDGNPVVIDWEGMFIGSPGYDAAKLSVTWKYAVVPPQMAPAEFIGEFYRHREEINRAFINEFTRVSGVTEAEIDVWMVLAAASRLSGSFCAEELDALLRAVRAGLAARRK